MQRARWNILKGVSALLITHRSFSSRGQKRLARRFNNGKKYSSGGRNSESTNTEDSASVLTSGGTQRSNRVNDVSYYRQKFEALLQNTQPVLGERKTIRETSDTSFNNDEIGKGSRGGLPPHFISSDRADASSFANHVLPDANTGSNAAAPWSVLIEKHRAMRHNYSTLHSHLAVWNSFVRLCTGGLGKDGAYLKELLSTLVGKSSGEEDVIIVLRTGLPSTSFPFQNDGLEENSKHHFLGEIPALEINLTRSALNFIRTPIMIPIPLELFTRVNDLKELERENISATEIKHTDVDERKKKKKKTEIAKHDSSVDETEAQLTSMPFGFWHQAWEEMRSGEGIPAGMGAAETPVIAVTNLRNEANGLLSREQCATIEKAFGFPPVSLAHLNPKQSIPESLALHRQVVQEIFLLAKTISFFYWIKEDYRCASRCASVAQKCDNAAESDTLQQSIDKIDSTSLGNLRGVEGPTILKNEKKIAPSAGELDRLGFHLSFDQLLEELTTSLQVKRRDTQAKRRNENSNGVPTSSPAASAEDRQKQEREDNEMIREIRRYLFSPVDALRAKPSSGVYETHILDFLFSLLFKYVLSNFLLLSPTDRGLCFRMSLLWPSLQQSDALSTALACWYGAIECEGVEAHAINARNPISASAAEEELKYHSTRKPSSNLLKWTPSQMVKVDFCTFSNEMRLLSNISSSGEQKDLAMLDVMNSIRKDHIRRFSSSSTIIDTASSHHINNTTNKEVLLANEMFIRQLQRLAIVTQTSSPLKQCLSSALLHFWFDQIIKSFSSLSLLASLKNNNSPSNGSKTNSIPPNDEETKVMSTILDAFAVEEAQAEIGPMKLSFFSLASSSRLWTPGSDVSLVELLGEAEREGLSIGETLLSRKALLSVGPLSMLAKNAITTNSPSPLRWSAVPHKNAFTCWRPFRNAVSGLVTPFLFPQRVGDTAAASGITGISKGLEEAHDAWESQVVPLLSTGAFSLQAHLGKLSLRALLEELRGFPKHWRKRVGELEQRHLHHEGDRTSANAHVNRVESQTHLSIMEARYTLDRLFDLGVCAALFCAANRDIGEEQKNSDKAQQNRDTPDSEGEAVLYTKLVTKLGAAFLATCQRLCRGCWAGSNTSLLQQQRGMDAAQYLLDSIRSLESLANELHQQDALHVGPLSMNQVAKILRDHIFTLDISNGLSRFISDQKDVLDLARRGMEFLDPEDEVLQHWALMLLKDEKHEASHAEEDGPWSRHIRWSAVEEGLLEIVRHRLRVRSRVKSDDNNIIVEGNENRNQCDTALQEENDEVKGSTTEDRANSVPGELSSSALQSLLCGPTPLFNRYELSVILRLLSRMRARHGVFLMSSKQPGMNQNVSSMFEVVAEAVANERAINLKRGTPSNSPTPVLAQQNGATTGGSEKPEEVKEKQFLPTLQLSDVEVALKHSVRFHLAQLPLSCQLDAVFIGLLHLTEMVEPADTALSSIETGPLVLNGLRSHKENEDGLRWPVDIQYGKFVSLVSGFVILRNTPFLLADSGGWEFAGFFPWRDEQSGGPMDPRTKRCIQQVSNLLRKMLTRVVRQTVADTAVEQQRQHLHFQSHPSNLMNQDPSVQKQQHGNPGSHPPYATASQSHATSANSLPTPSPHHMLRCYCLTAYLYILLHRQRHSERINAQMAPSEASKAVINSRRNGWSNLLSIVYALLLHTTLKVLISQERIFPDELLWCLSFSVVSVQEELLQLDVHGTDSWSQERRCGWWTYPPSDETVSSESASETNRFSKQHEGLESSDKKNETVIVGNEQKQMNIDDAEDGDSATEAHERDAHQVLSLSCALLHLPSLEKTILPSVPQCCRIAEKESNNGDDDDWNRWIEQDLPLSFPEEVRLRESKGLPNTLFQKYVTEQGLAVTPKHQLPVTPVERAQFFTATYWNELWSRLFREVKPLMENCKVRGNVKMSTNMIFSMYSLRRAMMPSIAGVDLAKFPGDALLHRAAVTASHNHHSHPLSAGLWEDGLMNGARRSLTTPYVSSLTTAATLLPTSSRSYAVIAQQIRSLREDCNLNELRRFLLALRDWGHKVHDVDFQYTSPAHPSDTGSADDIPLDHLLNNSERHMIRGTMTHNVPPPPLRTAWVTLCRRLCESEISKHLSTNSCQESSVDATELGGVLSLALHTGAVLQCADTFMFRQLLSLLLFDDYCGASPITPNCIVTSSLLATWINMVEACALASEERQEYAFLIREKFNPSFLGRFKRLDLNQNNLSLTVHQLCLFLEALSNLCNADVELWTSMRGMVSIHWLPQIRNTPAQCESLSGKKAVEYLSFSLEKSLEWSLRTAGFSSHVGK